MYLEQFFVEGLGHGSYLVGDPDAGVGAVVDPRRDVDVYLAAAQEAGLAIRHVLETHTHNDYVSGARELAAVTGATVGQRRRRGRRAALRPPPPARGRRGARGRAAPAGPGDAGAHARAPGLPASSRRAARCRAGGRLHRRLADGRGRRAPRPLRRRAHPELARAQYASVRRLLALPEEVLVYPTHGGGSFSGGGGGASAGRPWGPSGAPTAWRRSSPPGTRPASPARCCATCRWSRPTGRACAR